VKFKFDMQIKTFIILTSTIVWTSRSGKIKPGKKINQSRCGKWAKN